MKHICFAFAFICSCSFAEQSAVDELEELLSDLNQYQASFSQTVIEEDGYVLDEQSGVMSFERPNRFYWKIQQPYPSLLVSDGQLIYLHDIDLNQVRVRNWNSNPASNPIAVLAGDSEISDYYQLLKEQERFVLTPLNTDSGYESISIGFKNGKPQAMDILDGLGQNTLIEFSPLNEDIPENPYSFAIPVGAEIIHDD